MAQIAHDGSFALRVYPRRGTLPPHVYLFLDGVSFIRVSLADLRPLDFEAFTLPAPLIDLVRKYRPQALREWRRLNEREGGDGTGRVMSSDDWRNES